MEPKEYLMTVLRSVAAAFPIGSSIVNGWNEIQSQLEIERIEKFVSMVVERVENLEAEITKTKEEMASMFFTTMNYVARDPQIEKVPLYVGGLFRYGTTSVGTEEILNLVQQLETIDQSDIDTLQKIAPAGRVDIALRLHENSTRLEIANRQDSIEKLESEALIAPGGLNAIEFNRVYEQPESWPFNFFTQEYIVLHSGLLLLKIWKENQNA